MGRNIIQEIVDKHKISLRTFAKNIDYDIAMVSRVRNRQQKMSVQMAYQISKIYNLDLDEILNIERR